MVDKKSDITEYVKDNRRRLDTLQGTIEQQRSSRQIQDSISFGNQEIFIETTTDLIVNNENGNLIDEQIAFELISTKEARNRLIQLLKNGGSDTLDDTITGSGQISGDRREANGMSAGNGYATDTSITREGDILEVETTITLDKQDLDNESITEVGIKATNTLIQYYKVNDIVDRIQNQLEN